MSNTTTPARTTIEQLDAWREACTPYAFFDVRERGEYALGQIPGACPLPRGLIEVLAERLCPWRDVTVVLYSNCEHRSTLAAATFAELGYQDVRILGGGLEAWTAAGHDPAYGVNVIGKTYGEKLSITGEVQQLSPDEIAQLADDGKAVILDARTPTEHAKGHIPGAVNIPGGEIVTAAFEAGLDSNDRSSTIIVHCAGRTRSIVGAYLLGQAGFDNVYALRNGTMAWVMSGRELECDVAPWTRTVSPRSATRTSHFADAFVGDSDASAVDAADLITDLQRGKPTYLIDVRLVEEFTAAHLPGAISCPAGQLANAVDEFLAARDAQLVCYSGEESRSKIGAALLSRIGYRNVGWLRDGLTGWAADGHPTETGDPNTYLDDLSFAGPDTRKLSAGDVRNGLADPPITLVDVRRSSEYALCHIPGSTWVPRGDLERRVGPTVPTDAKVAVVSDRELRSALSARTLQSMGYHDVAILEGGLTAWVAAGGYVEQGLDGAEVSLREAKEDAELVAQRPELLERNRDDMVRYLDWEERLGEELLAAGGGTPAS